MSSCLIDWIGIYGCDAPTGNSSVYINQLPGINLESLEKLSDDEQKTYLGVWSDIQARGVRKFFNLVQARMLKKYRMKALQSTITLGSLIDTSVTFASSGQYRGFTYELKLKNQLLKSNFQALNVQKLQLYLPAPINTTIKIVNLDTAEVLFTKALTGVAGWNVVDVNQRIFGSRLFFGYDDTGITPVSLPINNSNSDWFNTMHSFYYGSGSIGILRGSQTINKASFGQFTEINVTSGNDTYGLSGIFSLVCVFDFLICNNKELLTTALWYLLGAEVMIERQYSSRLNRFTTIDREIAKKLEEYFTTEFNNELEIVVDGIYIDTNDCCVDCNTSIQILQPLL